MTKKERKRVKEKISAENLKKMIDRPEGKCYRWRQQRIHPPTRHRSEALNMNLFFVELHILAVSIIGVLLAVVVPEIMLNVMSRTGKRSANNFQG